ncbi:MAG: hypothetical protein ACD_26C00069G0002 [uncultured bacterium]|nr:MAG: hypothetical protein ACD_26C00069G0002 [uncultured bacterium]
MQSIKIIKRPLSNKEISLLIADIKLFPDLTYVSRKKWLSFKNIYVAEKERKLLGVCVIYELENCIKLGPLAVLKKHQSKGIGKALLKTIMGNLKEKNIFITSSNPLVKKIALDMDFEVISFFSLSYKIKLFLIKQLIEHISLTFFIEALRKKIIFNRKNHLFFIKHRIN